MCDGRSYEEIDEMTVHDLGMIGLHRRDHPRLEDLARVIAIGLGVYKPPEPREEVQIPRPPDPREHIRKVFSGTRFPELGDVSDVIR